jgi:hypothetical protein
MRMARDIRSSVVQTDGKDCSWPYMKGMATLPGAA